MPVRIGFSAHAEIEGVSDWRAHAVMGVRFFAGLLGVGLRVRSANSGVPQVTAGLMLWRRYFALKNLGDSAEKRPEGGGGGESAHAATVDETEPGRRSSASKIPPDSVPVAAPDTDRGGLSGFDTLIEESDWTDMPLDLDNRDVTPIRETLVELRSAWKRFWPLVRDARRRFRGAIKLRSFLVEGSVGTGDPAGTAWLLGAVYAAAGAGGFARSVRVAGEFGKTGGSGTCQMEWGISLLRVWLARLRLVWFSWKNERASRKKKENMRSKR